MIADVVQACVVTLEPVPAHIERRFTRELHLAERRKQPQSESEVVLDAGLEEGPEEIDNLHYDLAGPVLEEYVLALEPYPRCPGVEFAPPSDGPEGGRPKQGAWVAGKRSPVQAKIPPLEGVKARI